MPNVLKNMNELPPRLSKNNQYSELVLIIYGEEEQWTGYYDFKYHQWYFCYITPYQDACVSEADARSTPPLGWLPTPSYRVDGQT